MFRNFADKQTERLFREGKHRRMPGWLIKSALRKLALIHDAPDLAALRNVPGNRLEKLKGDRRGQHSVRVNRQWCVCFRRHRGDAFEVEVVDYHKG